MKAFAIAWGLGIAASYAAIPESAHPDFDLTKVPLPAKYKAMGLAFLGDGRMVLATTDFIGGGDVPSSPSANHKIFLVSNPGSASPQMTEISNTWLQIAGIVVANNKLYVSDRDGFYEINQLSVPADLKTNRKLIVKWPDENKWNNGTQWHQWVFTPVYKQGFFYGPYSGSIRPGGPSDVPPTGSKTGAFLKWDVAGNISNFAGGLRSPNGANIDEATGDMMVADNQGSWLPSSTFALMKQDKFYGHKNSTPNWAESLPYEPPIAWLPHKDVRASPSQPIAVKGGVFAGHWLLGDVNHPGLMRIAVDKVDASTPSNGAVFWFSKGFLNSALNRMVYGPDGAIYIGTCQTIAGNWPANSLQDFYRLAPKAGAPSAFEMKAIRSIKDGLELEFTAAVDPATAAAANFSAMQWSVTRQATYGAGNGTAQPAAISATEVSADGKRVFLKIASLVKDRVLLVKNIGVKSSTGKTVWNDEAWFTHNTVSTRVWNATVGVRHFAAARASALESHVRHHMAGPGRVSVTIESQDAWKAVLVSPDGATVDAAAGQGSSRFELSRGQARAGLHLLRVTGSDGEVVRKILF